MVRTGLAPSRQGVVRRRSIRLGWAPSRLGRDWQGLVRLGLVTSRHGVAWHGESGPPHGTAGQGLAGVVGSGPGVARLPLGRARQSWSRQFSAGCGLAWQVRSGLTLGSARQGLARLGLAGRVKSGLAPYLAGMSAWSVGSHDIWCRVGLAARGAPAISRSQARSVVFVVWAIVADGAHT